MVRFMMMLAFMVLVFGVAACGDGADTPSADVGAGETAAEAGGEEAEAEAALVGDAAAGGALFATTCNACHGPAGEGVEGLGKDMTTSAFIAGLSDDELLAFVKQGRPPGDPDNTTGVDMPPKGGNPALSDEELVDIIAFMRSIQQ